MILKRIPVITGKKEAVLMSGFKSFLFVSKRINLSLDVHKDVVLETEQLDIQCC